MKQMMRKLFALLMVAMMLCSSLPIDVLAEGLSNPAPAPEIHTDFVDGVTMSGALGGDIRPIAGTANVYDGPLTGFKQYALDFSGTNGHFNVKRCWVDYQGNVYIEIYCDKNATRKNINSFTVSGKDYGTIPESAFDRTADNGFPAVIINCGPIFGDLLDGGVEVNWRTGQPGWDSKDGHVTLAATFDLDISKTLTVERDGKYLGKQDKVQVGDVLHYTITVTNKADSDAPLPPETPLTDILTYGASGNAGGGDVVKEFTDLKTNGFIEPGGSETFLTEYTVEEKDAGRDLVNTAQIKGKETHADVTVTVAKSEITKTANPTTAVPGDTITYTLVVTNTGTVDPIVNEVVTDSFGGAISSQNSDDGNVIYNGDGTWTIKELKKNSTVTITYTYTIPDTQQPGTLTNTATTKNGGRDSADVTVNEKPKTGSLTITKVVKGALSGSFTMTVTGPDGYSNTVNVNAGESTTITDLAPGEYTVAETSTGNYNASYSATDGKVTVSAGDTAEITVTNTITGTTSVTGTKTWVDGGKTHTNADEVKLTLSRTSAKAGSEEETVDATATWSGNTYTFKDVAKYDAEGYAYTYSVSEAKVDGYTTTSDGNNFTNTMDGIDAKTDVTGTKTWVDGGKTHTNADEVKLTLSRKSENPNSGSTPETVTDATATWDGDTYTFTGLPKYDAEGYEYTYSVAETAVDGYTTTNVGNNFTNTLDGIDAKIDVTGTKTWVDGGKTHDNATEVTLTLSRTSAKAGSEAETVDATATWSGNTYTFANLPKYDAEGYEYTYSVAEAEVDGYTTTSDGNDFTNTVKTINDTINVTGTKKWYDVKSEGEKFDRVHTNAEEVTLKLYRTSAKAGSREELVNDADVTWDGVRYTFADVAKYDDEGYAYTYRVAEADKNGNGVTAGDTVEIGGVTYKVTYDGNDITNIDQTPKMTLHKSVHAINGTPTSGRPEVKVGDVITYHIWVSNDGYVDLHNIEITDTRDGGSTETYPWRVDELLAKALGAKDNTSTSTIFTFTYTVTEEDILAPAADGHKDTELWNKASATGHYGADNKEITSEAEVAVDHETVNRSLKAEKELTNAGSGKNGAFQAGETAEFDITVTNNGNVTQKTVTVSETLNGATLTGNYTVTPTNNDAKVTVAKGDTSATITDMKPGATVVVKAEYEVTQDDIDSNDELKNIATVKGDEDTTIDQPDEVDIPKEPQKKGLEVKKSIAVGNKAGDKAWFEIRVENVGNVTLKNIKLDDTQFGDNKTTKLISSNPKTNWNDDTKTIDVLAPGEAVVIQFSRPITQEEIDAGKLANTATASAKFNNEDVSATDTAKKDLTQRNGLYATKQLVNRGTAKDGAFKAGNIAKFTITVENKGNTTQKNVKVIEQLEGAVIYSVTWTKGTYKGWQRGLDPETNLAYANILEMAPGDLVTVYVSYKVTQEDIENGDLQNTATITPDPDRPNTQKNDPDPVPVPTEEVQPALSVSKRVLGGKTTFHEGDTIEFLITVKNDGNVPLTGVVLTDKNADTLVSLRPEGLKFNVNEKTLEIGDLGIGESVVVKATYELTPERMNVDEFTNTAEAAGEYKNKSVGPVDATATVNLDREPGLTVTKTASAPENGQTYALGEEITYTITVKNTGNVTVNGITVTDEKTNLNEKVDSLKPGDSKEYKVQHTITEGDILEGNGSYANTAKAEGKTAYGEPVFDDDTVTASIETKNGHLTVDKQATNTPANGATYVAGETITYEITVTNDGNLTITDITVTDNLTEEEWTIESLAPGESKTFTTSYLVTEDTMVKYEQAGGQVVNKADATGTSPDPEKSKVPVTPDEETVFVPVPNPSIAIKKEGGAAGHTTSYKYKLGDTITYYVTITNNGNVTLTGVYILDKMLPDLQQADITYTTDKVTIDFDASEHAFAATMKPNGVIVVTYRHTVTEEDIAKGTIVNEAWTLGCDPEENPVFDGPRTVTLFTEPVNKHLTVTKELTNEGKAEGGKFKVDDVAMFDITVTNDGNQTQKNVIVSEMEGAEIVEGEGYEVNGYGKAVIESIAPGETVVVKAQYKVQQSDIDSDDELENVATVEGEGTTTGPDPEPIPEVDQIKSMEATKTLTNEGTGTNANGELDGSFKANETATFEITVTNTGNTTQTNVVVKEQLAGATIVSPEVDENGKSPYTINEAGQAVIESLAPNQTVIVKASYKVSQEDIDSDAELKNIALVDGDNGTKPDPEPEVKIPEEPKKPGLTAVKSVTNAPEGGFKAGQTASFDITVTNSGNTTQYNVTVSEQLQGAKIGEGNGYTVKDGQAVIAEMAPGDVVVVKATYEVTQDDIDSDAELSNIAAVDGTPTPGVEIPEEPQRHSLTAVKAVTNAPAGGFKAGQTAEFTITVTNTGNTTQHGVTVAEQLYGATIVEGTGYTVTNGVATIEKMAPNDVVVVKATYTVTQADIDSRNELKNIALVDGETGNDPDPTPEVDIPEELENASLSVDKTVTSTPAANGAYALGETITYSVTVTNNGNQTLQSVSVHDELTNEAWNVRGTLAPGATSEAFTTSHVVTEVDILTGSVTNVATATGYTRNQSRADGRDSVTSPTQAEDASLFVEKTADVTSDAKLGDTITYTIKVTNNGNVTVSGISVTDPLTGMEESIQSLAPGASEEFTTSHVVTEEDIHNGSIANTATATGTDPEGDPVTGTGTETVETEEERNSLSSVKTLTNAGSGANGAFKVNEVASFTITVTNDGNQTQTDVHVAEMAGAEIVEGEGYSIVEGEAVIERMEPGASVTVNASYTVTQADIDNKATLKNIATVEGQGTTPDPEEEIPKDEQKPGLSATKTLTNAGSGENGSFKAGETASFDIVVSNTGNTTQTDVRVTEQLAGAEIVPGEGYTVNADGSATIPTIEVGGSVTVKASYTVKQADIDNNVQLQNVALVDGEGEETQPDPEPVPEEPKHPGLTSTKALTNEGSGEEGAFKAGDTANFDITVTNSGNTTQHNVIVTEQLSGARIIEGEGYSINVAGQAVIAELAPGETVVVKASYTVSQADIDNSRQLRNIALVQGEKEPEEPDPTPGTDIPEEPMEGHVTVTKATTSTPANGTAYALGETISYEITATNDGNLTITNVTVTDELTGDLWRIPSLAPGESESFSAEYVVTEEDILNGSVLNVATAAGTSPDPEEPEVPVEPGDKEDPTEPKNGHVTISKATTSTPANGESYALGETITYEITATNDGNLTVTDITVTDELTGDAWTIPSLEPGASESFTAEHVVTEEDILNGSVVNEATATGTSPDPEEPDVPVEPGDTEDPTEPKDGHITITKATTSTPANGATYALGETITYEITATNDGNLTIENVIVTDELAGAVIAEGEGYTVNEDGTATIAAIEPGASVVISASYVVTEADILAGSVLNEATAAGTSPDPDEPDVPVEPGDTEDPTDPTNGHMSVTKTETSTPANGRGTYIVGETITYAITVTNDGNLTLTNVIVSDELEGAVITEGEGYSIDENGNAVIETLAPEAVVVVNASYTVTAADVDAANITTTLTNTATATGTSPDPEEPTVTPDVPGTSEVTTEAQYTLTINYWYGAVGGAVAAPTYTRRYYADELYNVASPARAGYAVDRARVNGTMPTQDLTFNVIYTAIPYTLTVNYVYLDGTVAAPTATEVHIIGDGYSVTSPVIEGYTATRVVVAGTMPGYDLVVTVVYVPNETDILIDEYGVPLNIGNVTMNVGDCFE